MGEKQQQHDEEGGEGQEQDGGTKELGQLFSYACETLGWFSYYCGLLQTSNGLITVSKM
jgi:hypothetical protein